jgi:hypothetical protein
MIDHSVLHSSQDHLRTGVHEDPPPIVCQCKKHVTPTFYNDKKLAKLELH